MSRTITVAGTDRTSLIRLDSTVWVEAANRGEVGIGGYIMDDSAGTLDVPALKTCRVTESSASPTRMFSGFTADRSISRGVYRTSTGRQWNVMVTDLNALLDDALLNRGAGNANRPAETDFARITWLLSTAALFDPGVAAGQMPNTNVVNMTATDHRASHPRDVLEECAQKSGKNFFLYNWGAGTGELLYYDLATATAAGTTSSLRISNVLADVDNVTTFAPVSEVVFRKAPIDIYSDVRMVWELGAQTLTNLTTETTFRRRGANVVDTNLKTSTAAAEKAQKYLDQAATETTSIDGLELLVKAQYVNDIRAGQRLQIKFPHLGYSAFTYVRCLRREVRPAGGVGFSDVMYRVTLDVADNVKPTSYSLRKK